MSAEAPQFQNVEESRLRERVINPRFAPLIEECVSGIFDMPVVDEVYVAIRNGSLVFCFSVMPTNKSDWDKIFVLEDSLRRQSPDQRLAVMVADVATYGQEQLDAILSDYEFFRVYPRISGQN